MFHLSLGAAGQIGMDGGHGIPIEPNALTLAKTNQADPYCCPLVYPILVRPGCEDAGTLQDAFQHHAVAFLADGIGGNQPRSTRLSRGDLRPRLLEPVCYQIRASGDATLIKFTQCLDVGIAQFAAHHLVAQKRRITDDYIRLWPRCLAAVRVEEGVSVFDTIQGAEDGVTGNFSSIAAAPLNVADPDGDPGEFGGKFIYFDAANVVRSGLHQEFGLKPKFLCFDVGLLFHITQGF